MTVTIARSFAPRLLQIVTALAIALLIPVPTAAQPATWTVGTEAQLRTALTSALSGDRIFFTSNITLTADLPSVAMSVTINGGGFSLSGNDQYRGLFIAAFAVPLVGGPPAPDPISVTIQNLTITNTVATGGSGGTGGISAEAEAARPVPTSDHREAPVASRSTTAISAEAEVVRPPLWEAASVDLAAARPQARASFFKVAASIPCRSRLLVCKPPRSPATSPTNSACSAVEAL